MLIFLAFRLPHPLEPPCVQYRPYNTASPTHPGLPAVMLHFALPPQPTLKKVFCHKWESSFRDSASLVLSPPSDSDRCLKVLYRVATTTTWPQQLTTTLPPTSATIVSRIKQIKHHQHHSAPDTVLRCFYFAPFATDDPPDEKTKPLITRASHKKNLGIFTHYTSHKHKQRWTTHQDKSPQYGNILVSMVTLLELLQVR
jgi:hypothetical protein